MAFIYQTAEFTPSGATDHEALTRYWAAVNRVKTLASQDVQVMPESIAADRFATEAWLDAMHEHPSERYLENVRKAYQKQQA